MCETVLLVNEEQNLCVWHQAEEEKISSEEIITRGWNIVREELFWSSMAWW